MTAPQQTNREWLKMMAGQRAIRDHERFGSCTAEIEQLVAALNETADFLLATFGQVNNPSSSQGWSDNDAFATYWHALAALAAAERRT